MSKKKWWMLLSALLVAAPLCAQPQPCDRCATPMRKVWRDADLRQPVWIERRVVDRDALAGLKRREAFQFPPAGAPWPSHPFYEPPAPAAEPSAPQPQALPSYVDTQLYAEQPLYPFVYLVQSRRPLWSYPPRVFSPPAARPLPAPVFAPGRAQPRRGGR